MMQRGGRNRQFVYRIPDHLWRLFYVFYAFYARWLIFLLLCRRSDASSCYETESISCIWGYCLSIQAKDTDRRIPNGWYVSLLRLISSYHLLSKDSLELSYPHESGDKMTEQNWSSETFLKLPPGNASMFPICVSTSIKGKTGKRVICMCSFKSPGQGLVSREPCFIQWVLTSAQVLEVSTRLSWPWQCHSGWRFHWVATFKEDSCWVTSAWWVWSSTPAPSWVEKVCILHRVQELGLVVCSPRHGCG